jgi:SAM-dependent methyltransferase
MHPSVMTWVHNNIARVEIKDKDVAEVGSRDNNGTVYELISAYEPATYLGIDILPGPRVNVVCDAADLPDHGSFDVVISTECLDHCEDWKSAVTGMVTALKPGGIWMLTTRSEGFPYHRHPEDYWRFNLADMGVIADRVGMQVLTLVPDPYPSHPGVFIKARKPVDWTAGCIDLDDVTVAEVVKD